MRNLHVMLADNVKARAMTSDGTYRKKKVEGKAIQFTGNLHERSTDGKTSGEETTETDVSSEDETVVSERIE